MNPVDIPSIQAELIIAERDILARVALGGPIKEVLRDGRLELVFKDRTPSPS